MENGLKWFKLINKMLPENGRAVDERERVDLVECCDRLLEFRRNIW